MHRSRNRSREVQGQTGRLFPKKEPAIRCEAGLLIRAGGLGGGEPRLRRGLGMAAGEVVQVFVICHLYQVPVVQTCPAHGALRDIEAQGADQMETAAGSSAGAGDVAAILGDLRLHQDDIQHMDKPSFLTDIIFRQYCNLLPVQIQP